MLAKGIQELPGVPGWRCGRWAWQLTTPCKRVSSKVVLDYHTRHLSTRVRIPAFALIDLLALCRHVQGRCDYCFRHAHVRLPRRCMCQESIKAGTEAMSAMSWYMQVSGAFTPRGPPHHIRDAAGIACVQPEQEAQGRFKSSRGTCAAPPGHEDVA